MPLYNVEVSTIMVVWAEDESDAVFVASQYAREAMADSEPVVNVLTEITSKQDIIDDWDSQCRPYGGVNKSIGNILKEQHDNK